MVPRVVPAATVWRQMRAGGSAMVPQGVPAETAVNEGSRRVGVIEPQWCRKRA